MWESLDPIIDFLLKRPSDATPFGAIVLVPLAAVAYAAWRHRPHIARFRLRRWLRLVLSPMYLRHRSHVLDVIFMAANMGVFALTVGQATVSLTWIAGLVHGGLSSIASPLDPGLLNPMVVGLVWFGALTIGYEFAYWLDHYLCHNIPMLWEFHKVHHSAEVLSPLTNFRVHPIDSLVFANIVALCNGTITGVLHAVFGTGTVQLEWLNHTTLIALAITVFAQLQHTHVWIAFTGLWGRLILSPAHHQLHHSVDPRHHNKNLGNLVAVFDWAFGTLLIPQKRRQKLVFGVATETPPEHTINEGLVEPFLGAARHLMPPAQGEQRTA